jgi:hypothetical protein
MSKKALGAMLALTLIVPAPAAASPLFLLSGGMAAAIQTSAAQIRCVTYLYDRADNRTSRGVGASSPMVWGSSRYGCAAWNAS